ncbi:MAG: zinc-dependent metalloprotease [Planctomycetota bacterium]
MQERSHRRAERRVRTSRQHSARGPILAIAALVAASCSGGGGGGAPPPPITVGFEATSASVAEGSGNHDFLVRLSTSEGALVEAVTVDVADILFGGATSGTDYAAFAGSTVTFAIGSLDGDTRTVTVDVLDDADVEAPEIVTLELSGVTGPAVLQSDRLSLTIVDDEPKTSPFAFIRDSQGVIVDSNQKLTFPATGLGSTSAPQRVFVQNLGPSEFDWRAPVITGAAPGEFRIELVEVDGSPLPVPLPVSAQFASSPTTDPAAAKVLAFPFARTSATLDVPGSLVPDRDAMLQLAALDHVVLTDVPWPARDGAPERALTLELEALPCAFSDDAVVLEDGEAVEVASLLAGSSIWTGHVVGAPLSRVFVGLSPHGSRGWIQLDPRSARLHLVAEPLADPDAAPSRLVYEDLLPEGLRALPSPRCRQGVQLTPKERELSKIAAAAAPTTAKSPQPSAIPIPGWVPSTVRLALESDEAFYDLFGTTPAATNYVNQLVASVSELFERHVEARFQVVYLQLYPSADPWTTPEASGDALDLLEEFRAAWAPALGGTWPASADLGHLLSGDHLGGGIAYVDVIGNQNFAFAVSADMTGTIPWGTFTGAPDPLQWDYVVFSHELGHGFGAMHTHEYCPPIDHCYEGCETTTSCTPGTLMSYCHLCPQGLLFIEPTFHPRPANDMRAGIPPSIAPPTIGADSELVFEIRFMPYVTTGKRTARIDFTNDAPNVGSPFMIQVEGTAQ